MDNNGWTKFARFCLQVYKDKNSKSVAELLEVCGHGPPDFADRENRTEAEIDNVFVIAPKIFEPSAATVGLNTIAWESIPMMRYVYCM